VGIPEPVGDGDEIRFLIPMDMARVTGKYVKVGYRDGKGKTRPHPISLSCLVKMDINMPLFLILQAKIENTFLGLTLLGMRTIQFQY